MRFSLKVKEHLYHHQSEYQMVDVIDTLEFGRILILDGLVMLTERDEAAYHEMIVHLSAFTHPHPRRALVVGGGDGGSVRELLKHSSIESVDLVEIDREVVEVSRKYLPGLSSGFDDPRVNLFFEDGIGFVEGVKSRYDLAVVDSIDPVGSAVGLFEKPFYQSVFEALTDEGIMTAQAESPLYDRHISRGMLAKLKTIFPVALPYLSVIPTYPSALWTFIIASKSRHPLEDFREEAAMELDGRLNYYNSGIHRAAFALPGELLRYYGEGE